MAVAGGGALLLGGILGNRSETQRARVLSHPDDAPAQARRVSGTGRAVPLGNSVTINRLRAEVFAFWRDPVNLPIFLETVLVGTPDDVVRAERARGAAGDALADLGIEIVEEREGELISWRPTAQSGLPAGTLRFRDAQGGRGTIVEALTGGRSALGDTGQVVNKLLGRDPALRSKHELRRFKMLLETGEIATARNRPAEPLPPLA